MLKTYFLIMLISCVKISHAQYVDSLIQIYPGIGDTLTSFDRNYLGLFPEIDKFNYAVFYIRNNENLVIKTYSSGYDNVSGLILVKDLAASDSFYYIIEQSDQENLKLRSAYRDVIIATNEEDLIEGQLIMFDYNYLYIISENVRADNTGEMAYRILLSQVSEMLVEGNSDVFSGTCVGGLLGLVGGIVAAIGEGDLGEAGLFLLLSIGGLAIGSIVGITSSTEDKIIYLESDTDVLQLKGYAKYIIDKRLLEERIYYDINTSVL